MGWPGMRHRLKSSLRRFQGATTAGKQTQVNIPAIEWQMLQ